MPEVLQKMVEDLSKKLSESVNSNLAAFEERMEKRNDGGEEDGRICRRSNEIQNKLMTK